MIGFGGAIIPVGALLVHNYSAFGHPFDTGYSLTGEQQAGTGFTWESFSNSWRGYTEMLMSNGAGLFFGLGIVFAFLNPVRLDFRRTATQFFQSRSMMKTRFVSLFLPGLRRSTFFIKPRATAFRRASCTTDRHEPERRAISPMEMSQAPNHMTS